MNNDLRFTTLLSGLRSPNYNPACLIPFLNIPLHVLWHRTWGVGWVGFVRLLTVVLLEGLKIQTHCTNFDVLCLDSTYCVSELNKLFFLKEVVRQTRFISAFQIPKCNECRMLLDENTLIFLPKPFIKTHD